MDNLIINSKKFGDISLKGLEVSNYNALLKNAVGYDVDLTTMTGISKLISKQSFYKISPAQYMPVSVGENPYSEEILTYKTYSSGGKFSEGIINTGANNAAISQSNTAVEAVRVPVLSWADKVTYTILDLEKASRSGNWSLIESLETARKTKWDLGIQDIAFWGYDQNANVKGLLTQSDVTANTTLITKLLSSMTAAELNAIAAGLISAYRANANYTAMPTHFVIPESDYVGLGSATDASFPIKTKLAFLQEALALVTMNPNFKIIPSAYAVKAINVNVSGLNKNVYTLLNYDPTALRFDIPLDYNALMANTFNGFYYESVAMGQFGGVKAYKPKEMLYFTWA